jgi:putative Mg2+ transporter-C (MgtC) family protein
VALSLLATLDQIGEQVVGRLDGTLVARLVVALLLCGAVGLERSRHDPASGMRTHILVGLGACLMTMAGAYGFADLAHPTADPTRVASYVVSGIGFLGAGAILRHGTTVRGMTTAASLWGAAGIGLATGAGLAGLAAVTVGLFLFTLVPLQRWEARLRLGQGTGDLAIHLRDDSQAVGKTLAALAKLGVPVKRATVVPGAGTTALLRVELDRALAPGQASGVAKRLLTLRYVERVDTAPDDHEGGELESEDEASEAVGGPEDLPSAARSSRRPGQGDSAEDAQLLWPQRDLQSVR